MHSQLSSHAGQPVRLGPVAGVRIDTGGPYALLVPGYTGSKEDFAPILDDIAAAGLTPLAVDLPGQLDSPPLDSEDAYLPEPLGLLLASVIGSLDRPVILLGHSYGGLVARRAVIAGARVVGLTLLSTGPAALAAGGRRQVLELGEPVLRKSGVAAVHRTLDAMNATNPAWLARGEDVREFLRVRFLRNTVEVLLGMSLGLRVEPDLVDDLGRALTAQAAGCQVVCGVDDDAWPPPVQRDMADRLAAEFALVDGAAHSPAIENPSGLLAALLPVWKSWLG
ncbi:alpha/beta fold hydrolase [Actinokineospora inagensis]|uniref:alpha/beta fold hydrolase n=1 Tax=Actinokineospora inagensis TaxID=103730 RepID=UPI00040A82E2|nr:alpha/beta hydrolase [Actinokineospora inagensis]